jgi:hypothetical protein
LSIGASSLRDVGVEIVKKDNPLKIKLYYPSIFSTFF